MIGRQGRNEEEGDARKKERKEGRKEGSKNVQ